MNRLQKFVEQGAYGERPGRTAYAFNAALLPEPAKGLDWRPVTNFNPGDAILDGTPTRKAALFDGGERCRS